MVRLTAENRRIAARMKKIRTLLMDFGLIPSGYGPGVTAFLKGQTHVRGDGCIGEPITFDALEWKWLEPLLLELRKLRRENTKKRK